MLRCESRTLWFSLACWPWLAADQKKSPEAPAIIFTKIPPATDGGRERFDTISGRVVGSVPGQRIVVYGNRAAGIIDRIRSSCRKSPPRRELVDANRIIREILALLEDEATRSSVAVFTELAPEERVVTADRVQLQQVFMNLILNAIEAMKNAGGELVVKSQLERDGQLLAIDFPELSVIGLWLVARSRSIRRT